MSKRGGLMIAAALAVLAGGAAAAAPPIAPIAPSGVRLTPEAAAGAQLQQLDPALPDLPGYRAGQPVTTAVSPDGRTLMVLTSGYNQLFDAAGKKIPAASDQYVFVFDISAGRPRQTQVLRVPNSYMGLAFAADGGHLYVGGGVDDDVHVFALGPTGWAERADALVKLGHAAGKGIGVKPQAGAVAVTADGARLLVVNAYNDSLSIVPLADGIPSGPPTELSLQPGGAAPGGTYPFWVVGAGSNRAYVSSLRDREIDEVDLARRAVIRRIPIAGNPNRMLLSADGARLYVTSDNADTLSIVDTAQGRVVQTLRTTAPAGLSAGRTPYHGAAPNNLAFSPDHRRLYVTNGGENAVAVIALDRPQPAVIGLIPTGYWPNAVSPSADGRMLYVVNGKNIPGPNPGRCSANSYKPERKLVCGTSNQYILQLSKGGMVTLPTPADRDLAELTRTVIANDHLAQPAEEAADRAMMQALHARIKHVIYIVRENRTYDQLLGDLPVGNGDPRIAEFGAAITPNAHALASRFVTLDNFYDTGEVSGNGWPWSTSADETDLGVKNLPVNYSGRGLSYDAEGTNRNVNVALAGQAARRASNPDYPDADDILPGTHDVQAPDADESPAGRERGYLWDAAMRAGLSVRNYGFMLDLEPYSSKTHPVPEPMMPAATHTRVAFPANRSLAPVTDPYFRGFDLSFPDVYREAEWEREFAGYEANGKLPALSLVRLMHDHLGEFEKAMNGLGTPEAEIADNDYAVGKLIERVAHSRYAGSTLIVVLEDDAQDGPDHVDAHRSVCFLVGPYVKQGAVVSERYSTVNVLRTIEDILGFGHLSIYDAYQRPMTAAFDLAKPTWTYRAITPAPFAAAFTGTRTAAAAPPFRFAHDSTWWAKATAGMDWSQEDVNPAPALERIFWGGMHEGAPYPAARSGADLSRERAALLARATP